MKLDRLLLELSKLDQAQLKQVKAIIDGRLKTTPETGKELICLFDAVKAAINSKVPYSVFAKSTPNMVAFATHGQAVIDFVNETWPEATTSKVIQQALLRMLMDQLAQDLRSREIPLTLGTMSKNLPSTPEVFDKHFPGYRASGQANIVLSAMRSNPNAKG